jgi:hypothetical protein
MNVREFLEFKADFPDDTNWDQDGNCLVPGGVAIAKLIAQELAAHGYRVSEVVQHSYYGWTFDTCLKKREVWCLLSSSAGGWLLNLQQRSSLICSIFRTRNLALEEIQDCIQFILSKDNRFSNLLWYTREDYENGRVERASHSPR